MRHHGWELPYHPLQVVAMAVFLALGFAFYVFFAPFVGSHVLELISISMYSPLMVCVFGLYICCAAINPADPAVMQSKKPEVAASRRTSPSFLFSGGKNDTSTEPSIVTQPSSAQSVEDQEERRYYNPAVEIKANKIAIMAGGLAVSSTSACDDCLNCGYNSHQTCYDETLYCSLCEVEISKCSKHCRVCDKCVDRFDHHCRWLNNCIGRRNYRIFIALVISGVSMLILQWAIGVWVMARCFLNRVEFNEDIKYKLGGSFSVVPFLTVVAVCTVLAAFATLPLLQLSLFHALLIYKGISTYDYIVAMREKEQQYGVAESMPSPYASSGSPAATGVSVASSMDAGNHSPWCTPPHVEQRANQNVPKKSVAMESTRKGNSIDSGTLKKAQPKISPWMLARLNTEDAIRAGIEARRKSSILRPVIRSTEAHNAIPETDISGDYSSDVMTDVNASFTPLRDIKIDNPPLTKCRDIKVTAVMGSGVQDDNLFPECPGSSKLSAALTPLQVEARNAFCQSAGGTIVQSCSSSTTCSEGSPGARISCESYLSNPSGHHNLPCYNNVQTNSTVGKPVTAWFGRSTSDGYEASGGESADDSDPHNYRFNIQQQYAQWNDPLCFNVNQHIQTLRTAGSIISSRNFSRGTMTNTSCDGSSMDASRRSMEMVSSDNDSKRSVFRYVDAGYQKP